MARNRYRLPALAVIEVEDRNTKWLQHSREGLFCSAWTVTREDPPKTNYATEAGGEEVWRAVLRKSALDEELLQCAGLALTDADNERENEDFSS